MEVDLVQDLKHQVISCENRGPDSRPGKVNQFQTFENRDLIQDLENPDLNQDLIKDLNQSGESP
jgi:hypothetical protein